jgi:hypothetical protein
MYLSDRSSISSRQSGVEDTEEGSEHLHGDIADADEEIERAYDETNDID